MSLHHVEVLSHEPTNGTIYQKGQNDILVFYSHLGILPNSYSLFWKLVQEGGRKWEIFLHQLSSP